MVSGSVEVNVSETSAELTHSFQGHDTYKLCAAGSRARLGQWRSLLF